MHVLNLVEQLKQQGTAGETTELPELLNYIDGGVEAPQCSRENSLLNPNTLEPLQTQLACSKEQVERALASAEQAHEHALWENTPIEERADVLDKIADRLSIKAVREHIASVAGKRENNIGDPVE